MAIQNNWGVPEDSSHSFFSKKILLIQQGKQKNQETLEDLVVEQLTKINKKKTMSTVQFPHVITLERF